MAYTAPSGDNISFEFTDSGYSAPTGSGIEFEFESSSVAVGAMAVTTGLSCGLQGSVDVGNLNVDTALNYNFTAVGPMGVTCAVDAEMINGLAVGEMNVTTGLTSLFASATDVGVLDVASNLDIGGLVDGLYVGFLDAGSLRPYWQPASDENNGV